MTALSSPTRASDYFLGIDVGTQGTRAVVCDEQGAIAARAATPFRQHSAVTCLPGRREQKPAAWWAATVECLCRVVALLMDGRIPCSAVKALSIASTSGTVCTVDSNGQSLGPAVMYNDARSGAEADEANDVGAELTEKLGYRFSPSFALPKMLWIKRHEPERFHDTHLSLSPTDFLIGRLTGQYGRTDHSNALKSGYDLIDKRWPDFVEAQLGIPRVKLPHVVAPGTCLGAVSDVAARETGLEAGTPVLAGMTDGCAAQVSAGAVRPGQWNSTLGTTLVVKGVTRQLIRDPLGRVYCHLHPQGYWLPGGASNTGGECIARHFNADGLAILNERALKRAPTDLIVYPLVREGERLPFSSAKARGFVLGEAADEATWYAAHLEGVSYVETLGYDVLQDLGAEVGQEIRVAGGGTDSAAWLQLRADVLGKLLLIPAESSAAMGAAVVAAAGAVYGDIVTAARAMIHVVGRVEPRREMRRPYEDRYAQFCAACKQRGYIDN